ncbi:MAG: hypothetical protein L6R19_25880, partial [Alphaproteobacteria bacterium]|nr:hypothetical protein [Alphaproteobacteria bacterium]
MLQSFNKRRALRYALVNTLALVMAAPWPVLVAPKTAAAQQRPPYYQPAPYPPAPAQSPGTPQAAPGGQGTASMPGDLAGFEQPWPRAVKGTGLNLLVYQPQVEAWDGNRLELSAAVGLDVDAGSAADQHFGRVRLVALSDVDKDRGIVQLRDVRVTRVDLPTAPHRASEIDRALEQQAGVVARVVSLEQLQSSLAIAKAQRAQDQEVEVANEPPVILFSTTPAVLVLLDGEPVLRSTAPGIDRVINTNALLLRDAAGRYMLRVGGHWAEAESLQGPWTIKYANTAALDQIRDQVLQETAVDLLDDDDQPGPYGVLPDIYVSEVPAELLQTDGEPQFLPIPDTRLLYVANTASDIFVDTATQDHYVLISGRWFRARTMDGPWSYVDSASLPEDFRRIPEAHPKGGVLVSIAGTPQAQEAAIANTIPQTATIDRQNVQFQPVYDGEPQFQPVEGTPLHYAANGPVPVLRVDPHTYYAVDDGVWFTAPAPVGPWVVAEYVPPVIYTIPVYSPVHYVTYVRVYGHTPRHVHVGYTPGYLGTYVSRRGVVVYGTGYRHRPWVGRTYYAAPATYGGGAGFAAGAFTGFVLGLATAAIVSQPTWGPYRSWHYHGRHDRARGRDWRDRDGRFDGRSVARTDGRSSDQRTAAPRVVDRRTVEVSYTTNVYNTWDNRTAVRTTSVQPARTPETLRERRQQVEQLRQRSQASRERAARTRTTDPQATSAAPAPAGTAVVAAPARNDTFVDQRGNRRRGGERDGRTGARQRQAQPAATAPQPTQQQPTPQQAPPQQAAPRQAAPAPQPRTVEQQRRERQREELQRRS